MAIVEFLFTIGSIFSDIMVLASMLWAALLGIVVGMLPGLTATMGVAILTGLTFGFPSFTAISMLICMYVGAIYGGSRTAILLNIPGTPANAATTIDGFPLARSGRGAEALNLATIMSGAGSLIGAFAIVTVAPLLGRLALMFGSWEFAWLAIFGITICGTLTAPKDPLKGWMAGFLGLLISQIGLDGIQAFPRFTLGYRQLYGGISLLPVLVGVYGMPEILVSLQRTKAPEIILNFGKATISYFAEIGKNLANIIRSGLVSVMVGVIPGVGEDVAAWISYDLAKRSSKEPEKFGEGSLEGLAAAETGNNACVGGAIIPVLTLAVPGSAPAAVLLAALWLHGMRPGPLLPIENPHIIPQVAAMFAVATILITVYGLFITRLMLRMLLVPLEILMPIVFVLMVVGVFALAGRIFDVWVMLLFGVAGYFLRKGGFPVAPFVLGFILGPMADVNIRRSLILTAGDPIPFFTRPISLVLMIATIFILTSRYLPSMKRKRQQ